MKTYNVCDDGILREAANGDIGFWVKTIDYENAIAAKDARIAELEGLLREFDERGSTQDWVEKYKRAIAGQQQAEPKKTVGYVTYAGFVRAACDATTPSEDGREVPEVVKLQHMAVAEDSKLRWMTGRKIGECELYAAPDFGSLREPLMTVAQHSRIVDAKDAEIARLNRLIN